MRKIRIILGFRNITVDVIYVPPSLVGEGRIPCSTGAGGVGSIPANSDAQKRAFFPPLAI